MKHTASKMVYYVFGARHRSRLAREREKRAEGTRTDVTRDEES